MKRQKQKNRVHLYYVDLDRVSIKLDEKIYPDIKNVVHRAFQEERKNSSYEISVIITSDDYIARLNREYLDRDQVTDVLCFPYSTGKHYASDIFISVERANEQAKGLRHSVEDEIIFLVSHGLLHLFGWKDDTERNRKKMWLRQEQLLERLERLKDLERLERL